MSEKGCESVEISRLLACETLTVSGKTNCVLLCPAGGAISNMYAMLLARYKMFPEVKEKGMAAVPRLVAFTSEHVRLSLFSRSKVVCGKVQEAGSVSSSGVLFFGGHFLVEKKGRERLGGQRRASLLV